MRNNKINAIQKWEKKEFELHTLLSKIKKDCHAALLNNFDIPMVIKLVDDLVSSVYNYLKEPNPKLPLMTSVTDYIRYILSVFGIVYNEEQQSQDLEKVIN